MIVEHSKLRGFSQSPGMPILWGGEGTPLCMASSSPGSGMVIVYVSWC